MRSMVQFSLIIFWVWWCIILPSSVSTPRTPPTAFQGGAYWRLLVRKSNQNVDVQKLCRNSNTSCAASRVGTSATSMMATSSGNNSDNIFDKIARALGIDQSLKQPPLTTSSISKNDPKQYQGKVIRTAARPYQSSGGSIPSSRHYTTRKPSLPMVAVSEKGVTGDYNHYRTVALKSTQTRAISILTSDVSSYIQTLDGGYFANRYSDGDLGENVLVEGVDFGFFRIGQRYHFSAGLQKEKSGGDTTRSFEDVIVEITEAMEPCANLCKLPYINDPSLEPKHRVGRCQYLISALGQKEGLRGWYAKIIEGGVIRIGDSLSAVALV